MIEDHTQGTLKGILNAADPGIPSAELSSAAVRVLQARYLRRDAKGKVVETTRELFWRVAKAVAAVEKSNTQEVAAKFFDLMVSLRFLPNSPTLMNAGKPQGQLSACFVLPIEDDLKRVFETLRDAAVIHKTGGGTGFTFGQLRPEGSIVASSGGAAAGPVAFLKLFDAATHIIKQGGTRRGANMAILPVEHPDVEKFIDAKLDGGVENFNLSVGVSDAFLQALDKNAKWELLHPQTKEVVKAIPARRLWQKMATSAWKTGDPGVVFLDRINDVNPTPELGRMESTNPCGEQPLLSYESCNLGSINLYHYVRGGDLDWSELEADITLAVRFLDNVIDANFYPLKEVYEITKKNRKIGLGIMGWSDALYAWGIAYDSEAALEKADAVMSKFSKMAVAASQALAKERGAFPEFSRSLWAKRGESPRRNATVTTIAPTGTISIIAGVSSGIEPVYSLAHERRALDGQKLLFVHPALREAIRGANVRSRKELRKVLATGSLQKVAAVSPKIRRVFRIASEISPAWHIRMQAVFQKYSESAVSKTINLPHNTKVGVIAKIFRQAHELGCKGITVFRDQSKPTQVLNRGISSRKKSGGPELIAALDWLLDGPADERSLRKKASVSLASLSRDKIRQP